jgi:ubiquinone biosynthesis protein Coq4
MSSLNSANQQWQMLVFERFMEILQTPYGNFPAIWNLANAINDAESLKQIGELLSHHPTAKYAFHNRLLLGTIDVQQLHSLPKDTLGYAYAEHMLSNGFSPIQLPAIEHDYDYLMVHLTETHDIWHVVINADTSMAGEIQLQAFVAAQLQISRFSLAMLAKNLLKTAVEDLDLAEQHMDALTTGWLMGKQAEPLFGIQWNTLWEKPLAQLQTQWNILLDIPTTLGPARSTSNNSRNYVNFFEVST